jgi:hypothetical protein
MKKVKVPGMEIPLLKATILFDTPAKKCPQFTDNTGGSILS